MWRHITFACWRVLNSLVPHRFSNCSRFSCDCYKHHNRLILFYNKRVMLSWLKSKHFRFNEDTLIARVWFSTRMHDFWNVVYEVAVTGSHVLFLNVSKFHSFLNTTPAYYYFFFGLFHLQKLRTLFKLHQSFRMHLNVFHVIHFNGFCIWMGSTRALNRSSIGMTS